MLCVCFSLSFGPRTQRSDSATANFGQAGTLSPVPGALSVAGELPAGATLLAARPIGLSFCMQKGIMVPLTPWQL